MYAASRGISLPTSESDMHTGLSLRISMKSFLPRSLGFLACSGKASFNVKVNNLQNVVLFPPHLRS